MLTGMGVSPAGGIMAHCDPGEPMARGPPNYSWIIAP